MKKFTTALAVFLAVMMLTGPASAFNTVIPDDLTVDFRDGEWAGANGQSTYTVDSVTAMAEELFWGPLDLYQDGIDGLGIQNGGWERDEIEDWEILNVSFDEGMELTGVWITDLYESPDGVDGETGYVELWDESSLLGVYRFDGNFSDQQNGEIYVPFELDGAMVFSASFMTEAPYEGNEFSVAGFNASPEPGTIFLLAAGLTGLAVGRKRFAKK